MESNGRRSHSSDLKENLQRVAGEELRVVDQQRRRPFERSHDRTRDVRRAAFAAGCRSPVRRHTARPTLQMRAGHFQWLPTLTTLRPAVGCQTLRLTQEFAFACAGDALDKQHAAGARGGRDRRLDAGAAISSSRPQKGQCQFATRRAQPRKSANER